MQNYIDLLKDIMENGHDHPDRTGTGRRSVFGRQLRFDLRKGFPIVTTRKAPYISAFKEMLWFITGDINNDNLNKLGVKYWDKWAVDEKSIDGLLDKIINKDLENYDEVVKVYKNYFSKYVGSIGPMYGNIWRFAPVNVAGAQNNAIWPDINPMDIASDKLNHYMAQYAAEQPKDEKGEVIPVNGFLMAMYYSHVDQLQLLITNLKKDPYSARHVVTAWLPEYIPYSGVSPQENVLMGKGCLAPCHAFFQCFVTPNPEEGGKPLLSLNLYQRSVDTPIGAVSNISQYALLLSLLAHVTDMIPYEFIYTLGDTHIYANQLETVKEQIEREPKALPKLTINPEKTDIYQITIDDIKLEGYEHHDAINYPISV